MKRGPSEKKNEEAIVNMVMVVTSKNKVLEEEVFQKREPFKGEKPQDWQEKEKFKQLMV